MGRTAKTMSLSTLLAAIVLSASAASPAQAITAKGFLKNGEDFVHFDLTLAANLTVTAFNITKQYFREHREDWSAKWENWKNRWEEHREWRERWNEMMAKWASLSLQWRTDWERRWREEWHEAWNGEWAERWDEWEEWMEKWETKWDELKIKHIDDLIDVEIPEFIKPPFKQKMDEKFYELWDKHMNAPLLARCWLTPASQLGLKNALGHSLNKTLQWLYNSTDVYVKNFSLNIEVTERTVYSDGTLAKTGFYNLTESFDLYGVVINNASGTFVKSQFRRLNVTEKVDGGRFGFHGWVFTPSKALFMDLSAFGVPLEEWKTTYDSAMNTTTLTLVKDINVTTPYGNVVIDPEMILVVPGRATGTGDLLTVASILPSDLVSVRLGAVAMIAGTVLFAGYYLAKRRSTIPSRTSQP